MKVLLLGDYNLHPLAHCLATNIHLQGWPIDVEVGPFGQIVQTLSDPQLKAELVFVFPGVNMGPEGYAVQVSGIEYAGGRMVVATHIVPELPFKAFQIGIAKDVEAANLVLRERCKHILDLEALASYFGKNRACSSAHNYLLDSPFSSEFITVVARRCMTFIRLLVHPARKVLALDLDGVLWGGVAGEGSVYLATSGPGQEHRDIQQAIAYWYHMGVVLAICSKNNESDVLPILEKHPEMVLRPQHFAARRINWQDKAQNLRELAQEFNLGLDSFVFLDDSPMEREWVHSQLPEVLVLNPPTKPEDWPVFLWHEVDAFETWELTEEDKKRGELYAQEAERKEEQKKFGSKDEFVRSLNLVLTMYRLDQSLLGRAAQLSERVNQFNLTGKRYTEKELERLNYALLDPGSPSRGNASEVWLLGVQDRFGDYGISGMAVLKYSGARCEVDNLLLSCRVLGRNVEYGFLAALIDRAREEGAEEIVAKYVDTGKNQVVGKFLSYDSSEWRAGTFAGRGKAFTETWPMTVRWA